MNKITSLIAYLTITGIANSSVLLNPDFEDGKTGWNLEGNIEQPNKWIITPIHKTGSYGLMADNWAKYLSQSFNPVATESIIELSFATLTSTSGKTEVSLLYSNNAVQSFTFDTIGYTWQTRNLTSSLLANNYLQEIKVMTWDGNINTGNNIDTIYDTFKLETSSTTSSLSDFNTQNIPEPSSKSLLIYGLIALLFLKRKK